MFTELSKGALECRRALVNTAAQHKEARVLVPNARIAFGAMTQLSSCPNNIDHYFFGGGYMTVTNGDIPFL